MEVRDFSAKPLLPVRRRPHELASLPDDWDVIELAECATIQSGIAKNGNAVLRDPVSVPYLRVANVQDGYLDLREVSVIDIERSDLNRYAVLPGDVLMNEGGDLDKLGRGAIWHGQVDPCVHQNHVFVVRCKAGLRPEYLNAWTSTAQARRYFMLAGRQTTNLASINKTSLGGLTVAVPPTEHEQQDIANALGDADALIDSLEQLLTKKRQIKQGAMQELLTGKRRLPGFVGQWAAMTPFELAGRKKELFDDGDWIESEHIRSEGVRLIQTGNIGVGCFIEKEDKKYIDDRSFSLLRCKELEVGDILICRLAEPAGRACVLPCIEEERVITSVDVTIFRPSSDIANRAFLVQAFSHPLWFKMVSDQCGGTTHKRIARGALGRMEIALPSLAEQAAIAEVLSDMDSEITSLESRLTKARALKQAMAQALLTGRIRLVDEGAAA